MADGNSAHTESFSFLYRGVTFHKGALNLEICTISQSPECLTEKINIYNSNGKRVSKIM